MLDPTKFKRRHLHRKGAIVPMFALFLPVLLIFAGFAINLAYMQLVSTELKIATDAAAHAGGRAMSLRQTDDVRESVQNTIDQATLTAQANRVGGKIMSVGTNGDDSQIQLQFGRSIRGNNGYGMYEFSEIPLADILSGAQRPSSLGVTSDFELPFMLTMMQFSPPEGIEGETSGFHPVRRSVATQVDRDIALVLDRSGSMLFYSDEAGMEETLETLYNTYDTWTDPGYTKYHYWQWSSYWRRYFDRGYHRPEDASSSWVIRNQNDRIVVPDQERSERRISWDELDDATQFLYYRTYSNNVIFQIERFFNDSHTLGTVFSSSEENELTVDMAKYMFDWKYRSSEAARYSRWWFLEQGVDAFLDIVEFTDQEELVSLVTFSSSASLDFNLQSNYNGIRDKVDTIKPDGGTAIGDGLTMGLPPIVSGQAARPFAAKTIVVLTDGENNNGQDPGDAVADIVAQHFVTIHTVTFTAGADQSAMQDVAKYGGGRHYHADDGYVLVEIFEEIANNLPTILTE